MSSVFRPISKQDVIGTGLTIEDLGGQTVIAGNDGTPGTKWLAEERDPTADDGTTGDFFFNLSGKLIYGPKTTSGWGSPLISFGAAEVDIAAIIAATQADFDTRFPGWRESGGVIPDPSNILPTVLPFPL